MPRKIDGPPSPVFTVKVVPADDIVWALMGKPHLLLLASRNDVVGYLKFQIAQYTELEQARVDLHFQNQSLKDTCLLSDIDGLLDSVANLNGGPPPFVTPTPQTALTSGTLRRANQAPTLVLHLQCNTSHLLVSSTIPIASPTWQALWRNDALESKQSSSSVSSSSVSESKTRDSRRRRRVKRKNKKRQAYDAHIQRLQQEICDLRVSLHQTYMEALRKDQKHKKVKELLVTVLSLQVTPSLSPLLCNAIDSRSDSPSSHSKSTTFRFGSG